MSLVRQTHDNGYGNGLIKYKKHLVSPILHLTGHENVVSSCQFSPDGNKIASASYDMSILLWNVVDGVNELGIKNIHKNAITDVKWSRSGNQIYSGSADHTVAIFDLEKGDLIRRFREHESIVNALAVSKSGPELLASCSDDNFISVYDLRTNETAFYLQHQYPILTIAMDEKSIYSAGIDNQIICWDIRTGQVLYELQGHIDTITGIALSPDESSLVSTSLDDTCKIWDIKPFSTFPDRLVSELIGAPHGHEKSLIRPSWNFDSSLISCGSGDMTVVIWNMEKKQIQYKLPGHKGSVSQVDFHPRWNVIASCSVDGTLYLGDLTYQPSL